MSRGLNSSSTRKKVKQNADSNHDCSEAKGNGLCLVPGYCRWVRKHIRRIIWTTWNGNCLQTTAIIKCKIFNRCDRPRNCNWSQSTTTEECQISNWGDWVWYTNWCQCCAVTKCITTNRSNWVGNCDCLQSITIQESVGIDFCDGVWYDYRCQFPVIVESILVNDFDCVGHFITLTLFWWVPNETRHVFAARQCRSPWSESPHQLDFHQSGACRNVLVPKTSIPPGIVFEVKASQS